MSYNNQKPGFSSSKHPGYDLKRVIISGFQQAIRELLQDPLMACLGQSKESEEFMLDRIEEVLYGSVDKLNVEVITDLNCKLEEYRSQVKQLSERHLGSKDSADSEAKLQDIEEQLKKLREDNQRLKYLSKETNLEKQDTNRDYQSKKEGWQNQGQIENVEKMMQEQAAKLQAEHEEKNRQIVQKVSQLESKIELLKKAEGKIILTQGVLLKL